MSSFISYYVSPVGPLEIRCNETSVEAILFKETPTENTTPHPLHNTVENQLDAYFQGNLQAFNFPIAPDGTPFQRKVWDLLLEIPFGKTISYQTLATRYGDLKAIRAVASANGQNPLAIVIPCHRVIGTNGTLTGYAGGLHRKKWLLDHEAKLHHQVSQMEMFQ